MKRLMLIVLIGLVAAGAQVAAMGSNDPVTGAWYGGSTSPDGVQFKWLYVFTPAGPDRWTLTCEGAFAPEVFRAALKTQFGGEIRRTGSAYELRLACLTTNDTSAAPKELPSIVAARAVLTVLGPDQIRLTYDTAGVWIWGTVPFVDQPVAWMYRRGIDPPTVETLSRVKMDVDVALK